MARLNRTRVRRILTNILKRDAQRRAKRPLSRRVGSRTDRRIVRQAFFAKRAIAQDLKRIRKRGSRYVVRLGGRKRGTLRRFRSRRSARRAVIRHHLKQTVKRLGIVGSIRAAFVSRHV